MINNVISIPVHERAEVVIDQICNYKFFCLDCGIVLHISNGFNWKESLLSEEEFLAALKTFDNVFVNPTRLDTAFADIVHTHVSNFEYVSTVAEFEYFSLGASNDLFVRHMPPISDCDACFCSERSLERIKHDYWYQKVVDDEYLYKVLKHLGGELPDTCKSQIEGSFYRKELFQEIAAVINKVYGYEDVWNKDRIIYPREEFYYPTIANLLNKDKLLKVTQPNYVRVFWSNPGYLPTAQQIVDIAQGKVPMIYAVKRVLRKIDDPARIFIGTRIGNYREQSIRLMQAKRRPLPIKVLIFISGKDISNLGAALQKLASLYAENGMQIIGSTGVFSLKDSTDATVPFIPMNELTKHEFDFVLVTGGSVDINGIAPNVHFGDVLAVLKSLNMPEDKIILDRVLCVPGFTFDKYKKLKKSRPTIFAMNCFGGVIYHRFGLPFYSPTINMFTDEKSMMNFLSDPIRYINSELKFHKQSEKEGGYPIFSTGEDVFWYMNHYGKLGADFAKAKWNERKKRINWYNVIAFAHTDNSKILDEFDELPFAKKFCFVPFPSDKDSAVYLDPALDPAPNGAKRSIGDLVNRFGLQYNRYNYDWWDMLLYGKKSCY